MSGTTAERVMLGVTYAVLAGIGLMSAVLEAFFVPLRLPHGIVGLSAALSFFGNIAFGVFGGMATKKLAGVIVPIVSWFLTVGFIAFYAPGGDVILPGSLPTDRSIPVVTTAFFLLGILAGGIAVVVTVRFTRAPSRPTTSM